MTPEIARAAETILRDHLSGLVWENALLQAQNADLERQVQILKGALDARDNTEAADGT